MKGLISWAKKKDEERIRVIVEKILDERRLNEPAQLQMITHVTNINVN